MLGRIILAIALLVVNEVGATDAAKPKFVWVKEKEVVCDNEDALRRYLASLATLTANQVALDQTCHFHGTDAAYAISRIILLEQDSEMILIGKLYLWSKPDGPTIFAVVGRGSLEGSKEI